jgi:uncharacterized membrane protein YhaH (DUF805 family)
MDYKSLLFSFRGRINRAKYWLAGLIYLIDAIIMAVAGPTPSARRAAAR